MPWLSRVLLSCLINGLGGSHVPKSLKFLYLASQPRILYATIPYSWPFC